MTVNGWIFQDCRLCMHELVEHAAGGGLRLLVLGWRSNHKKNIASPSFDLGTFGL